MQNAILYCVFTSILKVRTDRCHSQSEGVHRHDRCTPNGENFFIILSVKDLNKITFLKDFVGNFGALPSAVSCPSVKKTIVSFQTPR